MNRTVGGPEGFVVVDKPPGCTSHDVVADVRRALRERRVGHGGTLDPDATGVLIVAVGSATRLLRYVADLDKTYTAEVVLGIGTSTLDASGEVVATSEMSEVTIEEVRAAAVGLTGTIEQIPPMVSAVRVGGKRLYELARAGEEIERAPRTVTVSRFDVDLGASPGTVAIEVDCTSGTYVRSLAADLGSALGGFAHLRALVRTRIGSFTLDEAVIPEEVNVGSLRPPIELVGHLRPVEVEEATAAMVAHGRVLDRRELGVVGDGPWSVTSGGRFIAVYETHGEGRTKPSVVFAPTPQEGQAVPAAESATDSVAGMRTQA